MLPFELEHLVVDIDIAVHLARADQRPDGVRIVAVAIVGRLHGRRLLLSGYGGYSMARLYRARRPNAKATT